MTRIDFYHLQKQNLEIVLPKLVEKAYALNQKIKIKIGNEARVEFINSLLWTYQDESFLPHGSRKDGSSDLQPIWLSDQDDNPNGATLLFLVDGADINTEQTDSFERVFNIFDGNDPDAVAFARQQWKKLKADNNELHYWQQNAEGRWQEK